MVWFKNMYFIIFISKFYNSFKLIKIYPLEQGWPTFLAQGQNMCKKYFGGHFFSFKAQIPKHFYVLFLSYSAKQ
jgi:hypothetical protein